VAKNDKGEATSQAVEVVDIPQEEEEVGSVVDCLFRHTVSVAMPLNVLLPFYMFCGWLEKGRKERGEEGGEKSGRKEGGGEKGGAEKGGGKEGGREKSGAEKGGREKGWS